ncbi:hypothetical protein D3C87_269400 [compost metagenome]
MKTNTFKKFLAVTTIMLCQNAFGQIPAIDSIKIIPVNPNAGDEVKAICYATFAYGDCQMNDYTLNIQGNQLFLDLHFTPGMMTYICNSVDTISLGNLPAGVYELQTQLMLNEVIKDHVIQNFTVGEALGIDENANTFQVSVQPNPFTDELYIETNARIEKAELSSISGQKIRKEIPLGSNQKIDLSDLKEGIYLLTLTDQNGNRYSKRIVKN